MIPCISMRTLGKAPENWQLPVKFVAARLTCPSMHTIARTGCHHPERRAEPVAVAESPAEAKRMRSKLSTSSLVESRILADRLAFWQNTSTIIAGMKCPS